MDANLLELWGQILLNTAKVSKSSQSFFDLFKNGFVEKKASNSLYNDFLEQCRKTYGKEGIESFNDMMKDFYKQAGVVPKTQYNKLRDRYLALKDKVLELEKTIDDLTTKMKSGQTTPSTLLDEWTETTRQYADLNQQFFKEFSKFFT